MSREDRGRTLGEVIGAFRAAGAPDSVVRERRQSLADFVRRHETRVHRATGADREAVRALLGWDDASLHRFVDSTLLVHSSTHVSMNAFAPMVAFPWFCLRLLTGMAAQGGGSHLRTQLTHNNLSDNRWKPHVWWRLSPEGRPVRTQLFSKQPRFKHQVLLAQHLPDHPVDGLAPMDAEALRLVRHATNFAYGSMMYRMGLERAVGLHPPDSTVEVPVDFMNAFSLRAGEYACWHDALYRRGLVLRRIGADHRLAPLTADAARDFGPGDPLRPETTLVCPNHINVGHAHRMGPAVAIGADRMASYEPEMTGLLTGFFADLGESYRPPQFLGVSHLDLDRLLPLPQQVRDELAAQGGRPSLAILVATHGEQLVPRLDAALSRPLGELASVVTRHVGGLEASAVPA